VYVYKKGKTTHIVDAYDLRKIATTKKYNTRNFKEGFKQKTIIKKKQVTVKIKGKDVKETREYQYTVQPLKRMFIRKEKYNKFNLVHSERYKRKKEGYVYLKIKFMKGKNITKVVDAHSSRTRPLASSRQRNVAWSDAYRRCISQINFSPDDYNILEEHYLYLENRPELRP